MLNSGRSRFAHHTFATHFDRILLCMKFILSISHNIRKPLLTNGQLLLRLTHWGIIRIIFYFLIWLSLICKLYRITTSQLCCSCLNWCQLCSLAWNRFALPLFLKFLNIGGSLFWFGIVGFVNLVVLVKLVFTLIYVFLIEVLILMMLQNVLSFFLILNTTSRHFVGNNKLNFTRFVIKWFFSLNLIVVLGDSSSMGFAYHSRFICLLSLII